MLVDDSELFFSLVTNAITRFGICYTVTFAVFLSPTCGKKKDMRFVWVTLKFQCQQTSSSSWISSIHLVKRNGRRALQYGTASPSTVMKHSWTRATTVNHKECWECLNSCTASRAKSLSNAEVALGVRRVASIASNTFW